MRSIEQGSVIGGTTRRDKPTKRPDTGPIGRSAISGYESYGTKPEAIEPTPEERALQAQIRGLDTVINNADKQLRGGAKDPAIEDAEISATIELAAIKRPKDPSLKGRIKENLLQLRDWFLQ